MAGGTSERVVPDKAACSRGSIRERRGWEHHNSSDVFFLSYDYFWRPLSHLGMCGIWLIVPSSPLVGLLMVELPSSVTLHLSTRARSHSKCRQRSSEAMPSAVTIATRCSLLISCTTGCFHSEIGVTTSKGQLTALSFFFSNLFCSLTRAIQLRGAGAVPGGHCAEPQRGDDLRGLRLTGLLPFSGLSD